MDLAEYKIFAIRKEIIQAMREDNWDEIMTICAIQDLCHIRMIIIYHNPQLKPRNIK